MKTVNCPKCNNLVEINISNSISDDGEVFRCPNCGWKFRYVEK